MQSLAAGTGETTLTLGVPPASVFVGLPIFVQGLVLGPGFPTGFTNLVEERILP